MSVLSVFTVHVLQRVNNRNVVAIAAAAHVARVGRSVGLAAIL